MARKTDICNMALSHIGVRIRIEDLDNERSPEADAARLLYDEARKATLRDHKWNFANRRQALALESEDAPPDWTYVYEYPTGCVHAREIMKDDPSDDDVPFEVGLSSTGAKKIILCNKEDAWLIFTFDVTNTALFDATFVKALSWRLAAEFAAEITEDKQVEQKCWTVYQNMIAAAMAADASEGESDEPRDADWVRARL